VSRIIRSKPLQYGLNKEERAVKIIVSLTSYPARFPTLDITIRSLLNQTLRPDKILLFLHKDGEYDKAALNIKALEAFGLEIVPCGENLGPHKKYFYAMQKYPDDIIITFDDDENYNKRIIECLFESYKRFPKAVSAAKARKIQFDKNGEPLPYKKWRRPLRKWLRTNKNKLAPQNSLFAVGVGGILYPPRCMDAKILFDAEKIKKTCLRADDMWLKAVQLKSGTKVTILPEHKKFRQKPVATQKTALHKGNIGNNDNDMYIRNIISEFKLTAADFKD
jgi:glycosyltransferase involved in cell wall biosynthesis